MFNKNDDINVDIKVNDSTKKGVDSAKKSMEGLNKTSQQVGKNIEKDLSKGADGASKNMVSAFSKFTDQLKTKMVPAVVGAMKTVFDGLADGINAGFDLASKRAENLNSYLNRMDARHQSFLKGGDVTVSQIEETIKQYEKVLSEVNNAKSAVEEIGEGYGLFGRNLRKRNRAASEAISDESENILSALGLLSAGNTTQGDINIINKYIEGITDEIQHAKKQLTEKLKAEAAANKDSGLLPSDKDVEAEARAKAEKAWAAYKEQLGIEAANKSADSIVSKMFGSGKQYHESTAEVEDIEDAVPRMSASEVAAFEKKYGTGSYLEDAKKNKEKISQIAEEVVVGVNELSNEALDVISNSINNQLEMVQDGLSRVNDQIEESRDIIEGYEDDLQSYQDKLSEASGADAESILANIDAIKQAAAEEKQYLEYKQNQEKRLKNEEAMLNYKQTKANLTNQLLSALGAVALGIANSIAQNPMAGGLPGSAISAAVGAVQTGIISAQLAKLKPQKFAKGGLLEGPSHANGGIPVGNTGIEVEGGEFIINKQASKAFLPLLQAINGVGTNGPRFANGGQLPQMAPKIPDIIVTVTDINKVSSRMAKVKGLV